MVIKGCTVEALPEATHTISSVIKSLFGHRLRGSNFVFLLMGISKRSEITTVNRVFSSKRKLSLLYSKSLQHYRAVDWICILVTLSLKCNLYPCTIQFKSSLDFLIKSKTLAPIKLYDQLIVCLSSCAYLHLIWWLYRSWLLSRKVVLARGLCEMPLKVLNAVAVLAYMGSWEPASFLGYEIYPFKGIIKMMCKVMIK